MNATGLKKIAIYSGEIPSTTFIERLIQGLAAKGHTIYLFGHISKKGVYSSNVKVSGFKGKFHKLIQWIKWSVLLGLFRNKEKQKLDAILHQQYGRSIRYAQLKAYPFLWYRPDIVHIQWAKHISEWMWLQDFGMKIVLSLRGAHINYSPLADEALAESYRRCFSKVDAFHAVSKAISEEAQKYGAPPGKIKVVYSGIDIEKFEPFQKCSYELQYPLKILSVGRFHWIKGYSLALDALSRLKKDGVNFEYELIAGKPSEEILYQVNDMQLGDEVIFHRNIPFEAVGLKMQKADLLLIPSLKEGLANVASEAMAIGLPVLSSDCGGMTEVIEHGMNGWLFRSMDGMDLGKKLQVFLSTTPEERAAISQEARKRIHQQHRQDQMIHGMVELYEECE